MNEPLLCGLPLHAIQSNATIMIIILNIHWQLCLIKSAPPLMVKWTSIWYIFAPEIVHASISSLEAGQDKGVFIDYEQGDKHYMCTTVDAVRTIIKQVSILTTKGLDYIKMSIVRCKSGLCAGFRRGVVHVNNNKYKVKNSIHSIQICYYAYEICDIQFLI